jgi:LysM repeat protein
MQCFACTRDAVQRCPRCGNVYCEGHGSDFCAACLDPLNAAPSRNTFRIAMLGLFGGCVLALWLLVRPPDVPGEGSPAIRNEGPTASPGLTPAGAGNGATGSVTPVPSAATTPQPSRTGAAQTTPTPAPTPTSGPTEPPAPLQYTVQDGDTWFGVAEAFGVDAFTLAQYNGRSLDEFLQIGEVLLIPQ